MNTVKIQKQNVKMIAHRGLSGIEQENTNVAFIAAGNRSYFGIETDVRKTADGQFVILHDDHTERVGTDVLYPEKTTFETLRALRPSAPFGHDKPLKGNRLVGECDFHILCAG